MTPRVSVVLASYNHASFVREAVDSVLTQSFADLELVITDDGSSDGTAEVIRGICDPRLRFHAFTENQGACVAMNDAIGRAQGQYIAVLNSDDFFLPGKLQQQVDFLDTHGMVGAVFGLPQFIDEHGRLLRTGSHAFGQTFSPKNRTRVEWLRHFFHHGNCLCHPTVMVRRACYEKAGLFDRLLMQLPDLDMWVRFCRDFEIYILPAPLTAFRILDRERNVSARSREKLARCGWESALILQHYADLPDAQIRAIFDPAGDHSGITAQVLVALAAIKSERSGYRPFGCALLRKVLQTDSRAFSTTEYFELVGSCDPFQVEFSGREYQWLRSSGLFPLLRRILFRERWRTCRQP